MCARTFGTRRSYVRSHLFIFHPRRDDRYGISVFESRQWFLAFCTIAFSHYTNWMLLTYDRSAQAKQIVRELRAVYKLYEFFASSSRMLTFHRSFSQPMRVLGLDPQWAIFGELNRLSVPKKTISENRMMNVSTCSRMEKGQHTVQGKPFSISRTVPYPSCTLSLGNLFQLLKVFSQIYFRTRNLCHRRIHDLVAVPLTFLLNGMWFVPSSWTWLTVFTWAAKLPARVKKQDEEKNTEKWNAIN